ncbi:MAG: hypothetical protein AB7G44_00140 [Bacteroidia bacterium]
MKLFFRYIFLMLAVFFASPLAGKSTQRYLKHETTKKEIYTPASQNNNASEKAFFCEQEETPENNLEELEEDETLNKFLLCSLNEFSFYLSKKTVAVSNTCATSNPGKLFLLFHSLKLYC